MRLFKKRSSKTYSEQEIRYILRPWVDQDVTIALTKPLLQDEAGSFLAPLLAAKGVQGGQTSGRVNVWRMLKANRERYESDAWKTSPQRAALVEAGLSKREQLREAREKYQATRSPWRRGELSEQQAARFEFLRDKNQD